MSDNEYEKDSVNLWVDPDRKDRWEAYLDDESDLQHMSQLVRRSVEQTINGSRTTEATIPESFEHQLSDVVESVQKFEDQVERLDDRLVSIEQAVRDNPRVRELANRIFEVVPTHAELKDYEQVVSEAGTRPPETVESAVQGGRVTDIAAHLDEPEQHVREALQQLQQDTHRIHTTEIDGERRFYKEV